MTVVLVLLALPTVLFLLACGLVLLQDWLEARALSTQARGGSTPPEGV